MAYRRKFIRRPRRKIMRRRKVTKKPSKFLKKTIQSMISKNIEDKVAFHSTGTSLTYFNSGIDSNADLMQVLPSVTNGSTEQHRIGDTIKAKTLVIKGYIQLQKDQTFGDVANKRIAVRLMCFGSKRFKDWSSWQALFGGTYSSALLQRGSSTVGFAGYINDLWTPMNTEEYTKYYDRVFYLSQDYVAQQTGSTTPTTTWSQDISKGIKFFTIRIPVKGKLLRYDNITGSYPTNWSCGLALGYAHLDGSAPDVLETRVGMCYDVNFTYEDA